MDQLIIWLTQTFATVLSSGKNTNTDSMRACMKFQTIQFYTVGLKICILQLMELGNIGIAVAEMRVDA